ncbi:MAG: aspartate kinase, partial [Candidatus Helarchaeales archaeon]
LQGITDLLLNSARAASRLEDAEEYLLKIIQKHEETIEKVIPEKFQLPVKEFLEDNIQVIRNVLDDIKEFEISPYKIDQIISRGEMLSTFLLTKYLEGNKFKVKYVQATEFLVTDSMYNDALPLLDITCQKINAKIKPLLKNDIIPVVTGFLARNIEGHVTTLGRGGTDFTATILAHCLKTESNEIRVILWKDVDGVLTTHPDIAPNARLIEHLSYSEAKEFAYFGAKLINPKCITPIQKEGILLELRNFEDLSKTKFTVVDATTDVTEGVKGITFFKEVSMISAISAATVSQPGVLAKLFDLMGKNNINVSFVSQSSSEINTTFVVDKKDGERAKKILQEDKFFSKWFQISVEDVGLIAIIGEGFNRPGILGRIFSALTSTQILAVSQASGGINISILVPKEQLKDAILSIHEEFIG